MGNAAEDGVVREEVPFRDYVERRNHGVGWYGVVTVTEGFTGMGD